MSWGVMIGVFEMGLGFWVLGPIIILFCGGGKGLFGFDGWFFFLVECFPWEWVSF